MSNLIHLYPPKPGGVLDYANVCLLYQKDAIKVPFETSLDLNLHLDRQYLLHYSGYGYTKRGAPLWLLNKLQTDRLSIKTLGVFFHELYAFGVPWSSACWLSPVQRRIARRLAEMSDFWVTNRESSAQWLRRYAGEKPHAVLPMFSTVGEMAAYTPERAPTIVVFGSAALRISAYRAAGNALFSWAREQGLELHDIGPKINDPILSSALRNAGVRQHGRLEAAEVSKQLSDAMFGILAYPVDYVAKSSVFAAYCTHGVCPVLISKRYSLSDGLVAGSHYLAGLPLGTIDHSIVRNIGYAAWNWYQPHRITAHVNTFNRLLSEVGRTS